MWTIFTVAAGYRLACYEKRVDRIRVDRPCLHVEHVCDMEYDQAGYGEAGRVHVERRSC